MKTAHILAVLGALAATPALAQGMQDPGDQSSQPNVSSPAAPQASNQNAIKSIQQALEQKGYNIGNADGVMGPKTRQALRQFQQEEGLPPNGQINQQTMAALGVQGGPQQAQTPEEQPPMQQHGRQPTQNQNLPNQSQMPSPQGGGMTR